MNTVTNRSNYRVTNPVVEIQVFGVDSFELIKCMEASLRQEVSNKLPLGSGRRDTGQVWESNLEATFSMVTLESSAFCCS